jgi:hypothetical protein
MISWLVLAAEAAEEESSHTAFYVAGAALAGWALIVSALGITQPNFPGSAAGRMGVIALTFLLVVGAASTAIITA